jgi:hypothetical protein
MSLIEKMEEGSLNSSFEVQENITENITENLTENLTNNGLENGSVNATENVSQIESLDKSSSSLPIAIIYYLNSEEGLAKLKFAYTHNKQYHPKNGIVFLIFHFDKTDDENKQTKILEEISAMDITIKVIKSDLKLSRIEMIKYIRDNNKNYHLLFLDCVLLSDSLDKMVFDQFPRMMINYSDFKVSFPTKPSVHNVSIIKFKLTEPRQEKMLDFVDFTKFDTKSFIQQAYSNLGSADKKFDGLNIITILYELIASNLIRTHFAETTTSIHLNAFSDCGLFFPSNQKTDYFLMDAIIINKEFRSRVKSNKVYHICEFITLNYFNSFYNTSDKSIYSMNPELFYCFQREMDLYPTELNEFIKEMNHGAAPNEKSDDVSGDKSDDVPNEKSDDVPNEKSDDVPNEKSDDVPNEKSDDVPNEKLDDVPNEKSDDVPNEKLDDVPNEKSDDVSNEKSDDVPNEKSDDVPNEKSDDVPNEKSDDVPNEKSDDVSGDKSNDAPNEKSSEASIKEKYLLHVKAFLNKK